MNRARAAWLTIVKALQDGEAIQDPGAVRPVIFESWRRSREAGVNPATVLLSSIEEPELNRRRSANERLIGAAAERIDQFSANFAGTMHVIYLTDRDGIVLYSRGTDFLMQSFGLRPGFDWSERVMGTNGAGTALACNAPVAVTGPEHWALPFHEASCLAAPIRGSDGTPIGAVDFSTHVADCDPAHLADVVRLAREIEEKLGKIKVSSASAGLAGTTDTPQ